LENPDGGADIEKRIKDRPSLGPTVDAETAEL
jgi:hypothetical protein